ncbi:MAG TPA: prepilin-type N-terminal cleavage/methylation domain-containing protein [Candidatus Acidoferrum sp.]|nr:prepilin-type N-terminal cleavage/methylation domain-containing protein [Candidatus Acidoferrum sp.]
MNVSQARHISNGFTLIETLIALVVLTVGVLGMAAVLANCIGIMSGAQYDYIAQQKALEAVESIYTARDLQQESWANIYNTNNGGIFLAGPQPLCAPGPDGIIGTADDDCTHPDYIAKPNPTTGFINTTPTISANGDGEIPLGSYRRTITISPVANMTDLRQIIVTITYTAGRFQRSYTLTTYISQYS